MSSSSEVVPLELDDTGNIFTPVTNHLDHSAEGVDTTTTKATCLVSFEDNTMQSTIESEKKKTSPKRYRGCASTSVSPKVDFPEMETEKENNGHDNLKPGTSHAPSGTLDVPTLEKTQESEAVLVIDDDHLAFEPVTQMQVVICCFPQ